jgi:hypothetical protein
VPNRNPSQLPRSLRISVCAMFMAYFVGVHSAHAQQTMPSAASSNVPAPPVRIAAPSSAGASDWQDSPPPNRGPRRMRYLEGAEVPEGYVLQEGPNRVLLTAGILALGIPYLTGVSAAILTDFDAHSGWLVLPVAGPWLMRASESDQDTRVLLGFDGLVQGAGALMVIAGLSLTSRTLVRTDYANFALVPARFQRGTYGLAAVGVF